MTQLLKPGWQVIENAVVIPPATGGRPRSGVFDAAGRFCETSATMLSNRTLSRAPELADPVRTEPGTHFYAGLGRSHFGHFLLESATRFWALAHIETLPRSAVFTPMPGADLAASLNGPLLDLYASLSGGMAFQVVKEPVRFERLIVPTQGFGHGDWITGTKAFRQYIAQCYADEAAAAGPKRLYISRSALRAPKQRVDQELQLEDMMRQAGYTVFHPQRHCLADQIEHYRAARQIVGGDGSAFHLLAFVARADVRIGLIQRRNRPEVIDLLTRQLQAFASVTPETFDPTLPLADQRALVPQGADAPTPIDLERLSAELTKTGFL